MKANNPIADADQAFLSQPDDLFALCPHGKSNYPCACFIPTIEELVKGIPIFVIGLFVIPSACFFLFWKPSILKCAIGAMVALLLWLNLPQADNDAQRKVVEIPVEWRYAIAFYAFETAVLAFLMMATSIWVR